ncbi:MULTISPECIES: hypothetical protein [unclassified Clostridium]|uniref:hypothetical protein n=1 Tax=unclassified Clostridium TaxID=2614128 RepID=UPI0025BBC39E|nr:MULTISPECIES: hypothetical protein [unclassified Clostridium]
MAEFLGVVELGTLHKEGEELPLPIRPWVSDSSPGKLSNRGQGNVPQFTSLKDMSKWIIGDTSSKAENKLKWIKIKDGNKILFICDRVILNRITWDNLNNEGYVIGKEITIDEVKYNCRLLTGGSVRRSGSDGYSGGILPNEYDRFIENADNISGLTKPNSSDLDKTLDYNDLDGEHNQLWHWWGNFSLCQEVYNTSWRVCRGNNSAIYFDVFGSSFSGDYVGWRPVLEIIKYQKYLIKQNNQYFSINPEFYDNETGQYKPVDKNFQDNGFDNIEDLTKEVNGFKPISKFKGKIEILKQDEK